MTQKNAIVAGAGLSGAAAARLLAENGFYVHVYEKSGQVGGNCYDEKDENGIMVQRYGPHIFHTSNKKVWDFCSRFARFNMFQHKVLSFAEGRLLNFPINRDTICEVFGVDFDISKTADFLSKQADAAGVQNSDESFESKVRSQVGDYLYEIFFKNYTIKQWNKPPSELSSRLAGRIPVRASRESRYFTDRYQGLPEKGFTHMIRNMLDHPNICISFNREFDPSRKYNVDAVVYTGRLDEFFDFEYGSLTYRSVDFEFETLDKEQFQPVSVVNYPNDYDFTRITEFKHFYDTKSSRTVILKEYPSDTGVPCYVVPDDENDRLRDKYYMLKENLENKGCYLFTGRLAEYKYYNMDQALEAVFNKIDTFIKKADQVKV